jgi:chemotaxis protein histidine kinase CheA
MSTVIEPLRAVWQAQFSRVLDRVDAIERALVALRDDQLEEPGRAEAQRAAHMLAGSVGTFGFTAASGAAAALDRGLDHPTAADATALCRFLTTLRDGVQDD